MKKVVQRVYGDKGLRFIFSTRSKLPRVLDANGNSMYGSDDYTFVPGKDEVVREGTDGYIITFGDALYRALDAVERAREAGINVGLINKVTLNVCDHEILQKVGKTKFVLVVESLSKRNGLGIRYGTWLLENGLSPKYGYIGTYREGCGGLWEQAYHQGYDSNSVLEKIKKMNA